MNALQPWRSRHWDGAGAGDARATRASAMATSKTLSMNRLRPMVRVLFQQHRNSRLAMTMLAGSRFPPNRHCERSEAIHEPIVAPRRSGRFSPVRVMDRHGPAALAMTKRKALSINLSQFKVRMRFVPHRNRPRALRTGVTSA